MLAFRFQLTPYQVQVLIDIYTKTYAEREDEWGPLLPECHRDNSYFVTSVKSLEGKGLVDHCMKRTKRGQCSFQATKEGAAIAEMIIDSSRQIVSKAERAKSVKKPRSRSKA